MRALAQESAWVANTNTSSCWVPPRGQKLCGFGTGAEACRMAIGSTTRGRRRCSGICTWQGPMAVCGNC